MTLASSRLTQSKNPFNVYASVRKAENDYKINPDEDLSGPKEYIYQPSFGKIWFFTIA